MRAGGRYADLLETFNNVVHYQLPDVSRLQCFEILDRCSPSLSLPTAQQNPELIYAICRSSARFDQLSTFTLSSGIADARAERVARKNKNAIPAAAAAAAASPHSNSGTSSPAMTPRGGEAGFELSTTTGTTVPTAAPLPVLTEGHEVQKGDANAQGQDADMSEKARGKRRERSESNVAAARLADLNLRGAVDVPATTTTFVGKNGFVPTESWVASWRQG